MKKLTKKGYEVVQNAIQYLCVESILKRTFSVILSDDKSDSKNDYKSKSREN